MKQSLSDQIYAERGIDPNDRKKVSKTKWWEKQRERKAYKKNLKKK